MNLWEANDDGGEGAILRRAKLTRPDVLGFLAASESGVYLTRNDVQRLRDACNELLAGGAS
jgi:hypothetical protein